MLLSAECTVEVVKHMLSNKERGMLRRTCKAFRNVRIQTDLFQKAYHEFLKTHNIPLTNRNGELVVRCNRMLVQDPLYKTFMRYLIDFTETVRRFYVNELNPYSIFTIDTMNTTYSYIMPSTHAEDYTSEDIPAAYDRYLRTKATITVNLNTLEEKLYVPFGKIKPLNPPIPCDEISVLRERNFNYIGYPKLILSPSDT